MLVVALTGGIGSGKSLAAEYFGRLGAKVIDADDLARRAIERGSDGFDEVVAHFGDSILKNGDIDRSVLAKEIFADPTKRKVLESIIHPRVKDDFENSLTFLKENDILIYEIPLLAESGSRARFDYVISIESPMDQRISRLKERGMHLSEIEARISSQASTDERRGISDLIIENDATPEALFEKVERIWGDVLPNIIHRKS